MSQSLKTSREMRDLRREVVELTQRLTSLEMWVDQFECAITDDGAPSIRASINDLYRDRSRDN